MGNAHKPRQAHTANLRNLSDGQLAKLASRATGRLYAAAVREIGRRGVLDWSSDIAEIRRGR